MSFARRGKEDSQKKERPGKVSDTTARGVIGMMVLIFIFQAVTFTIHKCSDGNQPPSASNGRDSTGNVLVLFEFDPNTISLDSLQMLGFSYKQALTVIHYREKGGRFRKKEDFSRMYTVSEEKYRELEPYISIPEIHEKEKKTFTSKPLKVSREGKAPGVIPEESEAEPQAPMPQVLDRKEAEGTGRAPAKPYNTRIKVSIDLNEADSAALISVKGIGPYFCKAILEYRKALGSFASVDQLLEIRGMDQEKFDRIKDQVFVHPGGIRKFSIAEADRAFLSRHPYIGSYNARGIAIFLQSHSKEECTLKALFENRILSSEDTLRLHPYVR